MGKHEIEKAINGFKYDNTDNYLSVAGFTLLDSLGIRSTRQMPLETKQYPEFSTLFVQDNEKFNPEKALTQDWKYIDFLFQITSDELTDMDFTKSIDLDRFESYLFFCLELNNPEYSRTALSQITREINKLFNRIPTFIIFKTGDNLTLSIINRRPNKRDESKDVLEKTTLIKDISIIDTHRAHKEILFNLSLEQLRNNNQRIESFTDLHKAWQNVLDTKELNKKFYKELSEWYFWAMGEVYFPNKNSSNVMKLTRGQWKSHPEIRETNATHLIRLLTRILFVWFIKEKNLVSEELFQINILQDILIDFDKNGQDSTYYKAILQNLFFATLNQEIGKRDFRPQGKKGRSIDNLWRYERFFTDKDKFKKLTENIPFINGGLFECLDKFEYVVVNGKRLEDRINSERIDWFSDEIGNDLEVPNGIFFIEEIFVDLSHELGSKSKNVRVRGLFNILSSYKFTIAENTPIEEDVALDPELLGNVFEDLLASYKPEEDSTARKQTGSYYTPKEIVNYMVGESLKLYLKQALLSDTYLTEKDIDSKLENLLAYTESSHCFNDSEVEILITAIDTCKIIDPACGSGAFPMSILHKLVFVLNKLDPNNKLWMERQKKEIFSLSDSEIREKALADVEDAFINNELDYGRKLFLIKNCIYGVDIQPIAAQISKLRFLISLMIDQNVDRRKPKENFKIRALPNLETKFIVANSLIGLPEREMQMSLYEVPAVEDKLRQLEDVRTKMFSARLRHRKIEYLNKDKELREELQQELLKGGANQETAEMIASWDPYDQNAISSFFDASWMFGITDGFDIVLGNPPYGLINKKQNKHSSIFASKAEQKYYKDTPLYQPAKGGMINIYRLFVCLSHSLLKECGNFSLIFPMAYMCDLSAANLRKYIFGNARTHYIEAFPERDNEKKRVFEAVKMSVCILGVSKNAPQDLDFFTLRINDDRHVNTNNPIAVLCANALRQIDPDGMSVPIATQEGFDLFTKITSNCIRLGQISRCYTGEIDLSLDKEYVTYDSTEIALIRGAQVQRYFTTNEITQGEILFLKSANYLANINSPRSKHHESKRILMQGITGVNEKIRLKMTLTDAGVFCANSVNYILPPVSYSSIEYILGLLNSKLINWFFAELSTNSNVNGYEVDNLPIRKSANQNRIEKIVIEILAAKQVNPNADTSTLEDEIDRIVYELYELTGNEIRIVEKRYGGAV